MTKHEVEAQNLKYRHGWFTAEAVEQRITNFSVTSWRVVVRWNIAYEQGDSRHLVFDKGVSYQVSFNEEREAQLLAAVINRGRHPWFKEFEQAEDATGHLYLKGRPMPMGKTWEDEYQEYQAKTYITKQLASIGAEADAAVSLLKLFLR